ncbi:MAG: hypothetical protein B7X71_02560 [Polynucleobacter sp. 39-46-10]|jgi:hypothetical protein|nr:MAG: hypothetical protein B7Y67_02105 [Polynucleobacter sp. 35-46-11]OZA78053.1 MAG: hypothetical protein B7X71_02560 [Polynucleobacter sp. 39-46-10]
MWRYKKNISNFRIHHCKPVSWRRGIKIGESYQSVFVFLLENFNFLLRFIESVVRDWLYSFKGLLANGIYLKLRDLHV